MHKKGQQILAFRDGTLLWGNAVYRCCLGFAGVSQTKREGDGFSPIGCFALRKVMFRADRLKTLKTTLPVHAIAPKDGWCDEPRDSCYNKMISLPYPASAEPLWREDNLYNIVVVLGYNDNPVIPHLGSAIFLHCINKEYEPTRGCIALHEEDLVEILKDSNLITELCILENFVRSGATGA